MTSSASVTTIEGRRSRATSSPLVRPIAPPASVAMSAANNGGTPSRASVADSTAHTPAVAPTATSTCPVRITIVMPTAMIWTIALLMTTSRRLSGAKKDGASRASRARRASSARSAGKS